VRTTRQPDWSRARGSSPSTGKDTLDVERMHLMQSIKGFDLVGPHSLKLLTYGSVWVV